MSRPILSIALALVFSVVPSPAAMATGDAELRGTQGVLQNTIWEELAALNRQTAFDYSTSYTMVGGPRELERSEWSQPKSGGDVTDTLLDLAGNVVPCLARLDVRPAYEKQLGSMTIRQSLHADFRISCAPSDLERVELALDVVDRGIENISQTHQARTVREWTSTELDLMSGGDFSALSNIAQETPVLGQDFTVLPDYHGVGSQLEWRATLVYELDSGSAVQICFLAEAIHGGDITAGLC